MNSLHVVLRMKCAKHGRLAWTKCCSNPRNPDDAKFHDGNFDQSVSSRVFFVGWSRHHACALSKTDQNPVVEEIRRRLPNCPDWIQVPNNGVGSGGVGKAQPVKASSIILKLSLLRYHHAVPLKSPATKSSSCEIMMARRVRMSFLAMPFFLAQMLPKLRGRALQVFLSAHWLTPKYGT